MSNFYTFLNIGVLFIILGLGLSCNAPKENTAQGKFSITVMDSINNEMEKKDAFYAVILDKDYNVLESNVKFPNGVYYPNVVNKNNEVVALKNPDLFDVEENYVTLYRMELRFE